MGFGGRFLLAYQSLLLYHDALRPEGQGQATQSYRSLVEDVEPALSIPGRKKDNDDGRANIVRAFARSIDRFPLAEHLGKILRGVRLYLEMGLFHTISWKAERGVERFRAAICRTQPDAVSSLRGLTSVYVDHFWFSRCFQLKDARFAVLGKIRGLDIGSTMWTHSNTSPYRGFGYLGLSVLLLVVDISSLVRLHNSA